MGVVSLDWKLTFASCLGWPLDVSLGLPFILDRAKYFPRIDLTNQDNILKCSGQASSTSDQYTTPNLKPSMVRRRGLPIPTADTTFVLKGSRYTISETPFEKMSYHTYYGAYMWQAINSGETLPFRLPLFKKWQPFPLRTHYSRYFLPVQNSQGKQTIFPLRCITLHRHDLPEI